MDSRKKPGGCPSQRFASKDQNEPWYGQWVGADRDHIVIYDGKDVFGTGQRFFLSTQASLLYEGLFDPFVPRPSHERLALISLRLDGKDKVRQACVFSRADHAISKEAMHCVCRALEADLQQLLDIGIGQDIAYMNLCSSSSAPPKNVHRSELLTARKMAGWQHPLFTPLVASLPAPLEAILRPNNGDPPRNSGQDVAVARAQQAPGMQTRAASAQGTRPPASQRYAEHVEVVDLVSDKGEADTVILDQDTGNETQRRVDDDPYEDAKCSLDCTCNLHTKRELVEHSASQAHMIMLYFERKIDEVKIEVYDDIGSDVMQVTKEVRELQKDVRSVKRNVTELKKAVGSMHNEMHALLAMVGAMGTDD